MATSSSFKVQCPSCEAMVPVKDANLIGKKIDCPKCKYRFVVEDPDAGADDVEEESDSGAKKGKDKKDSGAKGKKGGARRRTDDDGEPKFKKKGSGNSGKLLVGVGLAAVAVALLGVAVYMMMSEDTPSGGAGSPGGGGASASGSPGGSGGAGPGGGATSSPGGAGGPGLGAQDGATAAGAEGAGGEGSEKKTAAVASASLGDPSNLLPNEVDSVVAIRVHDLLETSLGKTLFNTPGASLTEYLQPKLGFPVKDVEHFLAGASMSKGWKFSIVRTSNPFKPDLVKAAWQLKPSPEGPVKGQDVYVGDASSWLEQMVKQIPGVQAAMAQQTAQAPAGPTYVYLMDDHTLVFGDGSPVRAFVESGGKPALKSQPTAKEPEQGGEGGAGGGRGAGGPPPGMSMGQPPKKGPGGMGAPLGAPDAGGNQPEIGDEGSKREQLGYLTVSASLKSMLNNLDRSDPCVTVALEVKPLAEQMSKVPLSAMASNPQAAQAALMMPMIKQQLAQFTALGFSLQMKEGYLATAGVEFGNENVAKTQADNAAKAIPGLAAAMTAQLGIPVEAAADQTADPSGGDGQTIVGGAGGLGSADGGGAAGGRVGSGPPPGMSMVNPGGGQGAGRGYGPPPGMGGGRGRQGGGGGGSVGAMDEGGGGGRAGGGGPGGQERPPGPTSTIRSELQGKTLLFTVHVALDPASHERLLSTVRPFVVQARGSLEMVNTQPRVHELSTRARAMVNDNKDREFPRGTYNRPLPSTRAGRPYPPDQRVSFFRDLLPYLGYVNLQRQIQVENSWRDPDNLTAGATIIPAFLDPRYPQSSWYVVPPGLKQPAAATHFVGVAGVGLDAADYTPNDPATEKKLGIFGYDRQTKLSDISDGASNTMMMVQVPPTFKRPWIAGGGATVQGVPETRSVKPFVSTTHNKRQGTVALMADGSVRFVADNVSDDVFKAMATIKGGEIITISRDAPKIEAPEENPELKADPVPAAPVSPPPPPAKKAEPAKTDPAKTPPAAEPKAGDAPPAKTEK